MGVHGHQSNRYDQRGLRLPGRFVHRAMACSIGMAREARMPDVAQAARWPPYTSSGPRQEQARDPSGIGGGEGDGGGSESGTRRWIHPRR